MGERKGLTKYYPPDFDPKLLPKQKRPKGGEVKSVFMLPMSVRCNACGEYMGAGSKFNAVKTTAAETYLGMKIFRFKMSCKGCPSSFVIRTDPQHSDYLCEVGAKRNFEIWRAEKEAEDAAKAVRDEQDQDAMQQLENKTLDARQEMEDLDALDELRTSKAQQAKISADTLLERHRKNYDVGSGAGGAPTDEQLEQEARIAFLRKCTAVKRLQDDPADGGNGGTVGTTAVGISESDSPSAERATASPSALALGKRKHVGVAGATAGVVVVKKKRKPASVAPLGPGAPSKPEVPGETASAPRAFTGIGGYGSSSDSDSSADNEN